MVLGKGFSCSILGGTLELFEAFVNIDFDLVVLQKKHREKCRGVV